MSRNPQTNERNMFQTYGINSNTKKQCILGAIMGGTKGLVFRMQREADTGDTSDQASWGN